MVLCLKIYREGGEGGTESSCPGGGWGGEVGDNLVVREVGGGSWGESSFPGGEGGGKPYIPYTFSH